MENTTTLYEHSQQKGKPTDSKTKKRATAKRDLIIRDKSLTLRLQAKHIDVSDGVLSQVYGIHNIAKLYIHKDIVLSISECYALSKYVKIYFIDASGHIVSKYKRVKRV